MKYKPGDMIIVISNITTVRDKNKYIGHIYKIKEVQGTMGNYGMRYSVGERYVVYESEICKCGCKLC